MTFKPLYQARDQTCILALQDAADPLVPQWELLEFFINGIILQALFFNWLLSSRMICRNHPSFVRTSSSFCFIAE